ncbi:hypothetical protein TNCV_3231651 [Trichonephila clavipes]|nr:hypothetical protein TNCV_3231651 [Trichonephila clavipes]
MANLPCICPTPLGPSVGPLQLDQNLIRKPGAWLSTRSSPGAIVISLVEGLEQDKSVRAQSPQTGMCHLIGKSQINAYEILHGKELSDACRYP